jgi:hypothetical protein
MRRSSLSVAQQAFALHARFPKVRATLSRGRLVWTGVLQPTPLSRSYRIQIDYQPPRDPRVRVLDELETRAEKTLPHTYVGGWLCLHEDDDWRPKMTIADTVVPWASEWLMYYEIWLATGVWFGGGEWPPRRPVDGGAREKALAEAFAGGH